MDWIALSMLHIPFQNYKHRSDLQISFELISNDCWSMQHVTLPITGPCIMSLSCTSEIIPPVLFKSLLDLSELSTKSDTRCIAMLSLNFFDSIGSLPIICECILLYSKWILCIFSAISLRWLLFPAYSLNRFKVITYVQISTRHVIQFRRCICFRSPPPYWSAAVPCDPSCRSEPDPIHCDPTSF